MIVLFSQIIYIFILVWLSKLWLIYFNCIYDSSVLAFKNSAKSAISHRFNYFVFVVQLFPFTIFIMWSLMTTFSWRRSWWLWTWTWRSAVTRWRIRIRWLLRQCIWSRILISVWLFHIICWFIIITRFIFSIG